MITLREKLTSYAVLGPFAIVLAFPFYWMLWTSFKSDIDLYNVGNVPFGFGKGSPTTKNYGFLFHHTEYLTWVKNTVFVGVVVVVITLALALPAGYALARLAGRWGQSLGVGIFLTYLVPPTLLFGIVFTATDLTVVYILTGGGPFNSTQMLTTWAYTTGIRSGSLGEGAAISLYLLPLLVVVAVLMLRFARRVEVS